MGAFIVNVNVRANNRQAVERQVAASSTNAAWVTGAKNGWITVYEERASTQDTSCIQELSERLSAALDAPVVAVLVHDSDFLCYWLFDGGRLLDEFNSCPDYFDAEETASDQSQGRPEILLNYCARGKQLGDVERVLMRKDFVFAEEHLAELAGLLGIDSSRAALDFRSIGSEMDPADLDAVFVGKGRPGKAVARAQRTRFPVAEVDEDAEAGDDEDDAPTHQSRGALASNVMQMLGLGAAPAPSDPQVERLVQAASENDIAAIDKLVAAGANIQGQGPLKLKSSLASSPLAARMLSGPGLSFPVTPLMAALANKQVDAARRLIDLGADLKALHPFFGTPVHAAVASGAAELLRLVLDAGGDANVLNAQRQTPLQLLQYFRQMMSQVANLTSVAALLGRDLKAEMEKTLPSAAALDECERLLRDYGGK